MPEQFIDGAQHPLSYDLLWQLWQARSLSNSSKPKGEQPKAYQAAIQSAGARYAFLVDAEGRILAQSARSLDHPTLRDATQLMDLPIDAGDTARVQLVTRRLILEGRATDETFLRVRGLYAGVMALLRCTMVETEDHQRCALVIATEMKLPSDFDSLIRSAFNLLPPEIDLLRLLVLGSPLDEIKITLGLTALAIEGRIIALLQRTGTTSLAQMVGLVIGLLDVNAEGEAAPPSAPKALGPAPPPSQLQTEMLQLRDGRCIEWLSFGAKDGQAILYMPFSYGLLIWPEAAVAELTRLGLRVFVPLRAGFGQSHRLRKGADWRESALEDYAAICDAHHIRNALVVTQSHDLRYALALSQARRDIVGAVLGLGASLPLQTNQHYDRMGKWQRFVLRNARYAPAVLPHVMKAAYSLLETIGPEAMLRILNATSPSDMEVLNTPARMAPLMAGVHHALLRHPDRSVEALTHECKDAEADWADLVHRARVPVHLINGDQDPMSPLATLQELLPDYPQVTLHVLNGAGQFLLYSHSEDVMRQIRQMTSR